MKNPQQEFGLIIKHIQINEANLNHVAKTGIINGTLLIEIIKTLISAYNLGVTNSAEAAKVKKEGYDIFFDHLITVDKQSILNLKIKE